MGIKRIVGLTAVLALTLGVILFLRTRASGPSVHIYTWSNYYPANLIAEFTRKTGIRVELTYLSSNEELFAKLKAGATGFDLIQPSDYMVRQMRSLNMIQPIDHQKLHFLSHIDPYYWKLPYDPDLKYSVPFSWGTTGIAINTKKIKVPEGGLSWDFLFNSPDPRHTSLLDDSREVFAAVLVSEGRSINTKDPRVLEQAKVKLETIKKNIITFNSEPRPLLLRGEINVAHIYSFDAVQAEKDNPNIHYFIPKDGGTLWTDNFAIPTNARHVAEAHAFIDFFLDPEVNYRLVTENFVSTPNLSTRAKLPAELANDPNIYPPPQVLARLQLMDELGDSATLLLNRLWTELKS